MNRYWAVIPAAGVGKRMQADRPKQYLPLLGKTVVEHSLDRLSNHPRIQGLVIALSQDDPYWPALNLESETLMRALGGAERCHSVLNGLRCLQQWAHADDWVLVHDAARPCVRLDDIDRLIQGVSEQDCGGLLGLPVSDTLKYCNPQGEVERTVSRDQLWRALTPQMFRLGPLTEALQQAIGHPHLVTDEASAMEMAGYKPRMIEGHADNIKITRPDDLRLAELYLQQQGEH